MKSCRKWMEEASQSLESKVGWWPRLQMFLHCRMCPPCGVVAKNYTTLRKAGRRAGRMDLPQAAAALQHIEGLSPEAKKKLASTVGPKDSDAKDDPPAS